MGADINYRYLLGFIFWVKKQVIAIARINTHYKYILGFIFLIKKQISTITLADTSHKYILSLIFEMEKQIFIISQVLIICLALYFEQKNRQLQLIKP